MSLSHSLMNRESNTSNLELILRFRRERNWEQFHTSKNLAISLVLEASEVLELFQWSATHDLPKARRKDLGEELADVYYWLLLLAHDNEIDLDATFLRKMKINSRKYPVSKSKGISTKYDKLR